MAPSRAVKTDFLPGKVFQPVRSLSLKRGLVLSGRSLTLRIETFPRNPMRILTGDANAVERPMNGPTQSVFSPCTRKWKAGTSPGVSGDLNVYFTSTHGPRPGLGVLKSKPSPRNATKP